MTDPKGVSYPIDLPTPAALAVALGAWSSGTTKHVLKAGDRWWRVVRAANVSEAREYACQCFASTSLTRFAPLERGASKLACAYAGQSLDIALWEVVLRDIRHAGVRRVPKHAVSDRYAVEVQLNQDIQVLNIRRPFDANLATFGNRPPDLTTAWPAAYATTRGWAQSLYGALPDMDGILYESHQAPGDCVVIYQDVARDLFDAVGGPQSVWESPVRERLMALVVQCGASVDFGDVDDDP